MASKRSLDVAFEGQSSTKDQGSLSYSVVARRQRSKVLAQKRRTTYKTIMDDLTQALPFPKDVVSQLDYNSRLRLALCFFRLKSLLDSASQNGPSIDEEVANEKEMTFPEVETVTGKSAPGMMQDFMKEALDGFLMVALTDGTITYLSESIHKHLGLFQSEHIGISLYDLVLEDDEKSIKMAIHNAEVTAHARLRGSASAEVGFFCRMKCSRFKVTNTISKTPGYKLVYISGHLRMTGSETFLTVVVRPVSPPSILELKVEGNMFVTHYSMEMKCTFFDGRLYQLMGYNKKDLLGDVVFTLHHHDDTEATMECSRGVMARGEGLSGYFRFLTRYGYYLWLQTRATVMFDSRTGNPSYIVCMNFVIDKEKGDAVLRNRVAAAKEANVPTIQEIDSRSHDPFPLVSREDGKVINPLSAEVGQATKQEAHSTSEPTTSNSDIQFPDSNTSSSAPGLPVLEESALPDSTSSETDSNTSSDLRMQRTNTASSSRTYDTGYSSGSSISTGLGLISPKSGTSEDVSVISSPQSEAGRPKRKTSPGNASSVFSSPPGANLDSVHSIEGPNSRPHSATDSYPVPRPSSASEQYRASVPQQNQQLASLLQSSVQATHTIAPAAPHQILHAAQQSNNSQAQVTIISASAQPIGGQQLPQNAYIKQEAYSPESQAYYHSNYTPGALTQQPTGVGTLYQQPPPPMHIGDVNTTVHPNAPSAVQSNQGFQPVQPIPQAGQQQYFQNAAPPQGNVVPLHSAPQHTTYPQLSFLPDWQDQVVVKNEVNGFGQMTGGVNQHFQPQVPSGQNFPSQPSHTTPLSHVSQPLNGHTAMQFNTHQTVSQMQAGPGTLNYPNSHPQPPTGAGVQNVPSGYIQQLPVLTGEDLKLLDELSSYPVPESSTHPYSQAPYRAT